MASTLPLPKYHRIYLILREQLQEGRFATGLPGELVLMRQFTVARVTVRKALAQLAAEGLILREPGRGTRPTRLTGLLGNLVSMGLRTTVNVIDVETLSASATVAAALRIAPGDLVQKAVRVRSTREGPLSHITTHVSAEVARRFGRRELARRPILVLLEESGVNVGRAEQSISAKLADADVARHLDVAVGSALLAVRRLVYDEQDRPVQWLHGLYRPDRYEYEMQLSHIGGIDAKVWVSRDWSAQFH